MKIHRLAIALLCLPILGCYEEPIRDRLHLVFTPGPGIVVTTVREISSPATAQDNAAVAERLDEARIEIESGWDRWSRAFDALRPIAERHIVERVDGQVRRAIHSALIDSFRPLERLLAEQGLGADFVDVGGVRELQLFPVGVGSATRRQRETVDRALTRWSQDVARYLEVSIALYEYLDRFPHRAHPCIAHVFDIGSDAAGPLSDREGELVVETKRSMELVAEALLIADDQAYSLNELSRLVFDSFQGRLTIAVDGSVIDVEGLVEADGGYERPPVDLWRSLATIAELWLSPDIVTALVRPGPADLQPEPDPAWFAGLPRSWVPAPRATTVEAELRARLRPEDLYRIRWRSRVAPDAGADLRELALERLATAERELPD